MTNLKIKRIHQIKITATRKWGENPYQAKEKIDEWQNFKDLTLKLSEKNLKRNSLKKNERMIDIYIAFFKKF